MRAVIFFNGDIDDYTYIASILHKDDYIVCADGGYRHALRLGVSANIVLGDMDSIDMDLSNVETKLFPTKKDYTDGELAIHHVIERGFDDILILGGVGSRLDHTLTNIFLLRQCVDSGIKACIVNEYNSIYMIGKYICVSGEIGDIVSLIPLTENVKIESTSGLEYDASGICLNFGTSIGNSNVMTEQMCSIKLESGYCLVIKSRDK